MLFDFFRVKKEERELLTATLTRLNAVITALDEALNKFEIVRKQVQRVERKVYNDRVATEDREPEPATDNHQGEPDELMRLLKKLGK